MDYITDSVTNNNAWTTIGQTENNEVENKKKLSSSSSSYTPEIIPIFSQKHYETSKEFSECRGYTEALSQYLVENPELYNENERKHKSSIYTITKLQHISSNETTPHFTFKVNNIYYHAYLYYKPIYSFIKPNGEQQFHKQPRVLYITRKY